VRGKGMSKTVLAGEKSLTVENYIDGIGAADTRLAYVGDSDDIRREPVGPLVPDNSGGISFGGPHSGGANIAYCDGSLQFVRDDVALEGQ
jgi:prepilin-type processing-associated H-X9-DG protein